MTSSQDPDENQFSFGDMIRHLPTKTNVVTELPPARIPGGTLYSAGDLSGGRFTLNSARLDRGKLKIVRNTGVPHADDYRSRPEAASPSGRIATYHGSAASYIVALKKGVAIPVKEGFGRRFTRWHFTGFSRDERCLSYNWFIEGFGNRHGGSGIYDTESHRTWEQEGALLAVWSRAGQHLVFIRRHSPGGTDAPRGTPEGAILFFRKDARRLNDPSAERITQEEAVRLVGPWYRPLVSYSAKERFNTYEGRDLEPNQIAPRNRGIVLINSHDPWEGTWPPMPPQENALVWTTQYLDVSGRSPIYKPAPPLYSILSWSPDAERVYGITGNSSFGYFGNPDRHFLCFWVRTGKYAHVPLPETLGTTLSYVED